MSSNKLTEDEAKELISKLRKRLNFCEQRHSRWMWHFVVRISQGEVVTPQVVTDFICDSMRIARSPVSSFLVEP